MHVRFLSILTIVVAGCTGDKGDTDTDTGADADTDTDADSDTTGAPLDILAQLSAVDGMTVTDLTTEYGVGFQFFLLAYAQPVDHADPGGPTFTQYMTLIHRDEAAPTVLVSTGYSNYFWDYEVDLSARVGGNQLIVEKRYHADSRPAVVDWTTMTVEQIATDHHRVVEALAPIYTGPWISQGYSMGGVDVVLHRYFFPDDVVGVVSYVSPFEMPETDPRFLSFFDTNVDQDCNAALEALQVEMLGPRRAAMEALAEATAAGYGATFDRVGGVPAALESTVWGMPFSFWQYSGTPLCGTVPDISASDADIYAFFEATLSITSASDGWWSFFDAYYWQAQTETGYPAYRQDHLDGLLSPDAVNLDRGLVPTSAPPPVFDAAALDGLHDWLLAEGDEIVFVYGTEDPWFAAAMDVTGAAGDVRRYDVPFTHGVEIGDLLPADAAEVEATIAGWTGGARLAPRASPPTPRPRLGVPGRP